MNTVLHIVFLLLFVQTFSLSFEAPSLDKKQVIRMCVDPSWMPFEMLDKGKHIGISADYMKIIESKIPLPIQLIPTKTWSESLEFAQDRKCDILSLAMPTPERKKYMNFTRPYLIFPLVIATTMDKFFITDIKEFLDKKFGVCKGYAYTELLRLQYPSIQLIEVESVEDGLKALADGELYGFIDNVTTIGYQIQRKYIGTLKVTGRIDQDWKLSIAVRKDDPMLLKMLDKAIGAIDEKSRQAILNQWMRVDYEPQLNFPLLWKILSFLFFIALFVFYRYNITRKYNQEMAKYIEDIDKNVLISSTDVQGTITEVSQAFCDFTGYTKEELIGENHRIIKDSKTKDELIKDLWDTISSGKKWHSELCNRKKDGSTYWVDVMITPTFSKSGKLNGYKSIRHDISAKKRMEELAITDQLTKIYNRLFLENSIANEIDRAKRYQTSFSIILLDIDLFKRVNDTYGHQVGDSVLVMISKLLKDNVRGADILGRWGGEEFLIICPQTVLLKAKLVAEKLREVVASCYFQDIGTLTCSFGVSEYKLEDKSSNPVVKRADDALYEAKNLGRNLVVVSDV